MPTVLNFFSTTNADYRNLENMDCILGFKDGLLGIRTLAKGIITSPVESIEVTREFVHVQTYDNLYTFTYRFHGGSIDDLREVAKGIEEVVRAYDPAGCEIKIKISPLLHVF